MFFSSNLKLLRQRKGISQTDLALALDLTRTTLIGYEKGVQPPFAKLLRMADHFKVSLDALVRYDLSQLSAFQLSEIERGMEVDITGHRLRLLTITTDRAGNENIEMVAAKAHAGYAQGHGDPEYVEALPRFQLPFLPKNRSYRCFQTVGDSMPPVPEGAWVTCSFVTDWTTLRNGTACILVTKDDGIVFKLVYNELAAHQRFQLVSTNRHYLPYVLPASAVVEIWKFETWNSFTVG